MLTIEATVPCPAPPAWALLERALLDALSRSVDPFLAKYTRADGALIWRDTWDLGRDGVDDFYEACSNWPLLYLLGGDDRLLELAHRQWEAITRQLSALGPVLGEYERGYDQFHQSEHYTYFYTLCLADPANERLRERARRFAGLYMGQDPAAPNYDSEHKIIRAPHNGSAGPRWGIADGEPSYGWSAGMRAYGLPFHDLPGIAEYDDLRDSANARRMGQAMHERMGRGDVAANLGVASLAANAYLLTGDTKCRDWLLEYVGAWAERARRNGGLLPDNVGLSGEVGEYTGGKWYGGLYGWTWPHGFYNIGMAAVVAAAGAYLVGGDASYLDLARAQIDHVWAQGAMGEFDAAGASLAHHWVGQRAALGERRETYLVPYRYGDNGWFDEQPMSPIFPAALWAVSHDPADWERVERIRRAEPYDWRVVTPFRTKEDAGHEQPWLRFLAGENSGYPEAILRASYATMARRLALIRADTADLAQVNIHHWQELNPVTTEALVQLTLGAPQPIYNGGLLHCPLRWFDARRQRPGLPPDVAALVERVEPGRVAVRLVNTSPLAERELIAQAGAFGEHRFSGARYSALGSLYPGSQHDYAAPELVTEQHRVAIDATHVRVVLPPSSEIALELEVERFVNRPSYALPW